MSKIRTHYDNLKVARNAPVEVIRAAYKTLSQKYHPDKNNSEDSERIMKIINESYEILSDPNKRRKHDEWIVSQETKTPNNERVKQPEQQRNRETINFNPPESGECLYSDLTPEMKKNIKERISGANKEQYRVKLETVLWKYVWLIVFVGWFYYLFDDASLYKWSEETNYWYLGITFIASVFFAKNLAWVYSWHTTPLQSWLIVTPLYIIKTQFNKIRYWPIWSVSDIQATHNYRNGGYQDTSLIIHFDEKPEYFSISPKTAYQFLVNRLQEFDSVFRNAVAQNNIEYLIRNDDFYGLKKSENKNINSKKISIIAYLLTLLTASALYAAAFQVNYEQPIKPKYVKKPIPAYTSKQPNAIPNYTRPALAPNGAKWPTQASYVKGYKKLHRNGLSSVTVDNTRNSSNVFVKLVSLDSSKAYPVRVFYIPAHSQFTVNNIRKGRYDIRYRDLNTGALARAEPFNLEEVSTYEGTSYSNIKMTLYKVRRGNMQTYQISESEF